MNVLIINESPFLNFSHSRYCYNLIKYLDKKGYNIYLYIYSIYKEQENLEKPFTLIKYNDIKSFYINLNLNSEDENIFKKITYILKTDSGFVNEGNFNLFINKFNIVNTIFLLSSTILSKKEYQYKTKSIDNKPITPLLISPFGSTMK